MSKVNLGTDRVSFDQKHTLKETCRRSALVGCFEQVMRQLKTIFKKALSSF